MFNYSLDSREPGSSRTPGSSPTRSCPTCRTLAGGRRPHGKYVHLYLNGLYWGLYNVHERPDDSFADEYYGGDKDDYYVIKHASDDPCARSSPGSKAA